MPHLRFLNLLLLLSLKLDTVDIGIGRQVMFDYQLLPICLLNDYHQL